MDKVHTPLSSFTLGQVKDLLDIDSVFSKLTDSQKTAAINAATQELADLLNRAGKTHYYFDTIGDGELVLSPTLASFEGIFSAYIKIKIGAYDGEDTVINDVDATKVLLSLSEGAITINDSDSDLIVYTLPITGATLNPTFKVTPPYPSMIDVIYSGNNVVVTARKNHVAFDIEIEKRKESV